MLRVAGQRDFRFVIVIDWGNGEEDRITVLPDRSRQSLIEQMEGVRRLHREDLAKGFGAVYLPCALGREYLNSFLPAGGRAAYKRHYAPAFRGTVGPKARGGQDADPSPSLRLDSPRGE